MCGRRAVRAGGGRGGGPAMLRQSALDAVKTWRFRPYMLSGEPVEVETTVNLNFSLGG